MNQQNIKPNILSVQAGSIPYYTFRDYFKKAKFIDIHGLTIRQWNNCELTRYLPRIPTGWLIAYQFYFANQNQLKTKCNIPYPEIIYGSPSSLYKSSYIPLLKANGYIIMYHQSGNIITDNIFKGKLIDGAQFIAIRNDLFKKVKLRPKEIMYPFKFLPNS